MFNGILQCAVIDAVTVSTLNLGLSVICSPTDLGGWRKWRFGGSRMSRVFAFDWYTELFEPGPDCGLTFEQGSFVGDTGVVGSLFGRQDERAPAPGVVLSYFTVDIGPCCTSLLCGHGFGIDRSRRGRVLFERVIVDGADLVARWRDGRGRNLRETATDPGHRRGHSAGDVGVQAHQLGGALTNVAGEGLGLGLPGRPLGG